MIEIIAGICLIGVLISLGYDWIKAAYSPQGRFWSDLHE